ncbi:MAG: hypothetical protein P8X48_10625 [Acidiferrobacteraceae bacterium]|jgi:uncharacterized protein YneF (UPF0154 family)
MNRKIIALIVIVFLLGAAYGGFLISRKISYEIFYKHLVQQTIRDMVKPDSLKEDSKQ